MNRWVLVVIVSLFPSLLLGQTCGGKFPNLITDICWSCLFPLNIGPVTIAPFGGDNLDPPPPLICNCGWRPGIGISFWGPDRLAEVVRTPFCSPTLNGTVLGKFNFIPGTNFNGTDGDSGQAFYQVHWLQFPILSWIGMILSGMCFVSETFDIAYMSELDPLWNDDNAAFVLNPEAVLFTSPITQAACAADSVKAAATDFGFDVLFWCAGSQGSVYPLSGNHANHIGGVDSSLAIVHKMIFKLHREFLAYDTSTPLAMCSNVPQPILRKNQYKQQMLYPIAQNKKGYGLGAPSAIWGSGKEFPYQGEDFSYLIWRKRQCCFL